MLGPLTNPQSPFDRLAGIPVFAGAMDAWATAVGAGATRAGQGYDIAGTSEVAGLITHAPGRRAGSRFAALGRRCVSDRRPDAGRRRLRALVPPNFSRSRHARGGGRAGRQDAAVRAIGRCSCLILRASERRSGVPTSGARSRASRAATAPTIFSGRCWKAWRWRCATFLRGPSTGSRQTTVRDSRCRRRSVVERLVPDQGGRHERAHGSHVASRDGLDRRRHRRRGRTRLARDPRRRGDAMCPIERVFEPRSALAPFYAQRAERYDRARQHAIAEADAARSRVGAYVTCTRARERRR